MKQLSKRRADFHMDVCLNGVDLEGSVRTTKQRHHLRGFAYSVNAAVELFDLQIPMPKCRQRENI